MKKALLIFLLSAAQFVWAQNEIAYINYEPNMEITGDNASLYIDFNGDGNNDIRLYTESSSIGPWYYIASTNSNWLFINLDEANVTNDTPLPELENWTDNICWNVREGERFGVRHDYNGIAYYGWFLAQWFFTYEPTVAHIAIDKYAYCTIPNYPLRWGQTSLNESVEENDGLPATLHPNPTNGIVNINGENIANVEVVNISGQTVLRSESKGDNITVDLSKQPSGIYFFEIRDKNGKMFTRKVVKE